MFVLIIGGSGSGKSAYAESVAMALKSQAHPLYYLATMQVYGKEGQDKVERHRRMRAGKGFITVECQQDIYLQLQTKQEKDGEIVLGQKVGAALLECMSNLTANEMFREDGMCSIKRVVHKILTDLDKLYDRLEHLVIVSNNVFEDGVEYDEGTMQYIEALGQINVALAERADVVTEVVVGIPVSVKGKNIKIIMDAQKINA
ncbi:MAG: bifunctional adenosylcobinamide kinase/adenosylcobinamide-phosphate guanylyltransferase [Lachnospiraceae bacterium]